MERKLACTALAAVAGYCELLADSSAHGKWSLALYDAKRYMRLVSRLGRLVGWARWLVVGQVGWGIIAPTWCLVRTMQGSHVVTCSINPLNTQYAPVSLTPSFNISLGPSFRYPTLFPPSLFHPSYVPLTFVRCLTLLHHTKS